MREPGLHITRIKLREILDDLMPSNFSEKQLDQLVKDIFNRSIKHSLTQRALSLKSQDFEKKAVKIMASSIDDADLFASILLNVRRKMRHVGVTQIKKTSKDWIVLKQVVANANLFCEDFEFKTKKEGYQVYLTTGIRRMSKFMLFKFLSIHEYICENYDAAYQMLGDDNKELTLKIHDYYCTKIAERTSIMQNYKGTPEKFINFYKVRLASKKFKVEWKHYIDSQFYGFEWRDGIPDPTQLVGEKAIARLNKYLYEKNIKSSIKTGSEIDWSKIKKANDRDTDTE